MALERGRAEQGKESSLSRKEGRNGGMKGKAGAAAIYNAWLHAAVGHQHHHHQEGRRGGRAGRSQAEGGDCQILARFMSQNGMVEAL